jgi:hypothetical protein
MQQKYDDVYVVLVERHTMNELADTERRMAEIQRIISAAVDAIYGGLLREDELRLQKAVIASAKESLYDARRERDIISICLKARNSLNTGPLESSNATKEVNKDQGKGGR